jgi:2,5-diamino-6-(ribosylamino)-4(3H)-pyrimidinone 5'-phosphate reductase
MRPRVVVHSQVSLDGRMDWLPIDPGLYYELAAHWQEDATLAGTDTLLAAVAQFGSESPQESGSAASPNAPLLVVPDSRGRLRHWETLLSTPYWRGGVALCTKATPQKHIEYLEANGVDHAVVGEDRVDFRAALEHVAERYGTETVRVDSGGTLTGVLLRNDLVDEVSVVLSPYLVGGTTPRSFYRAPDLNTSAGVIALRLSALERLANDAVWLRYEVVRDPEA